MNKFSNVVFVGEHTTENGELEFYESLSESELELVNDEKRDLAELYKLACELCENTNEKISFLIESFVCVNERITTRVERDSDLYENELNRLETRRDLLEKLFFDLFF